MRAEGPLKAGAAEGLRGGGGGLVRGGSLAPEPELHPQGHSGSWIPRQRPPEGRRGWGRLKEGPQLLP